MAKPAMIFKAFARPVRFDAKCVAVFVSFASVLVLASGSYSNAKPANPTIVAKVDSWNLQWEFKPGSKEQEFIATATDYGQIIEMIYDIETKERVPDLQYMKARVFNYIFKMSGQNYPGNRRDEMVIRRLNPTYRGLVGNPRADIVADVQEEVNAYVEREAQSRVRMKEVVLREYPELYRRLKLPSPGGLPTGEAYYTEAHRALEDEMQNLIADIESGRTLATPDQILEVVKKYVYDPSYADAAIAGDLNRGIEIDNIDVSRVVIFAVSPNLGRFRGQEDRSTSSYIKSLNLLQRLDDHYQKAFGSKQIQPELVVVRRAIDLAFENVERLLGRSQGRAGNTWPTDGLAEVERIKSANGAKIVAMLGADIGKLLGSPVENFPDLSEIAAHLYFQIKFGSISSKDAITVIDRIIKAYGYRDLISVKTGTPTGVVVVRYLADYYQQETGRSLEIEKQVRRILNKGELAKIESGLKELAASKRYSPEAQRIESQLISEYGNLLAFADEKLKSKVQAVVAEKGMFDWRNSLKASETQADSSCDAVLGSNEAGKKAN